MEQKASIDPVGKLVFVSWAEVQIGVFIQNVSTKPHPAREIKYQAIISEGEVEGQSKRAKDE